LWMAVRTLPCFASLSSILVIIAPETPHADSQQICDLETYRQRMWCRVEVFSYYCRLGVDGMYIAKSGTDTADSLVKVTEEDVKDVILVFEGDATCCARNHENMATCDKQSLRDTFIGIYADVLWSSKHGRASQVATQISQKILRRIQDQKI